MERIQKILSARGVASRRKAEEMLRQGLITVNGNIASLGDTVDPDEDEIMVEGKLLPSAPQKVYILLNKPRGYVTTLSDEKGRDNAAQLVADCGVRVYPVGRLDMDSEGLLLFTNDGEFANAMMHPKTEVNKTYEVWCTGYTREALTRLSEPMELDGYLLHKPQICSVQIGTNKIYFHITIHEGRNRQIRRMCEKVGMRVVRLRRIQEGNLKLGNLAVGQWRYLTQGEIEKLLI